MANRAGKDSLMRQESLEAPSVVARMLEANAGRCAALAERLKAAPPPFAVTCARGSSDNAGTFAKYLFEIRLGMVTASVGPSVSSVFGVAPRMRGALFLAISQSGRSPDLLSLADTARKSGALTVALVNDTNSPLAESSEIVLPLLVGTERSVAATKSYIAAMAAILQLLAHWSGDAALHEAVKRLPEDMERAAALDWSAAEKMLASARHLFAIGRGPGFAIAQEAALKMKETCGLHAEALSAAELMHGPLALPGPDFPVLVFAQPDASEAGILKQIAELDRRGVPVIVAGAGAGGKAPGGLILPSLMGLHPFAAPIALIQSFYLLVEAVSRRRGWDPDNPPHLHKVTETR